MPPLRANFTLPALKTGLAKIGIFLIEEFADGQVRWGDRQIEHGKKFKGRSVMTAPYIYFNPGKPRFDIFTIRNIVERLGKSDQLKALEEELFSRIHDED